MGFEIKLFMRVSCDFFQEGCTHQVRLRIFLSCCCNFVIVAGATSSLGWMTNHVLLELSDVRKSGVPLCNIVPVQSYWKTLLLHYSEHHSESHIAYFWSIWPPCCIPNPVVCYSLLLLLWAHLWNPHRWFVSNSSLACRISLPLLVSLPFWLWRSYTQENCRLLSVSWSCHTLSSPNDGIVPFRHPKWFCTRPIITVFCYIPFSQSQKKGCTYYWRH